MLTVELSDRALRRSRAVRAAEKFEGGFHLLGVTNRECRERAVEP
jgi:hypothetical protein